MIPLSYFLLAWIVLLAIYALLTLVSVIQMVRFAVASSMTYFSTAVFLIVAVLAIGATCVYLATVDWNLALNLGSLFQAPTIPL
ncbi:MAG: hypothetical protein ABIO72_03390 [Patescibacteria group bacterium]